MKRLLFARKDLDPNLDGKEVNTIIQDASQAAFDKLCDGDKLVVNENAKRLADKCNGMSHKSALELLAAVSFYVGGNNGNKR
jgi:hypothetical protein